jgi:hypothetical protein
MSGVGMHRPGKKEVPFLLFGLSFEGRFAVNPSKSELTSAKMTNGSLDLELVVFQALFQVL